MKPMRIRQLAEIFMLACAATVLLPRISPATPDKVLQAADLRARAAWLDSLRDYAFTAEITMGVPGLDMNFEISHKAMGQSCFMTKRMVMGLEKTYICDGDSLWTVMPGYGTYSVAPWVATPARNWREDVIGNLIKNPPYPFEVLEYLVTPELPGTFTYAGEDSLVINGRPSPFEVYTIVDDPEDNLSDRIWVDPRLHIVVRMEGSAEQMPGKEATFNVHLDSLVLDQGLTVEGFRFHPQEGLRRVESPDKLLVSNPLEGQTPSDVLLTDLSGRQVSTADWRGKVVVLDFWATWCGPCKQSLPHLRALATEFQDRVLFVGVTGEQSRTVSDFLQLNPSPYPILLDGQGLAAKEFGVTALPTLFILDQDGKVRQQFVGAPQEDVLRGAIDGVLQSALP